jgi:hypothetical protein
LYFFSGARGGTVIILPILILLQVESYAASVITIRQVGSSVQAVATGSLDLTALANTGPQNPGARVRGAGLGANVIIGFTADTPADGYTTISGPSVIGDSTITIGADIGSGGPFGINMSANRLLVPQGFTGGAVSANATWSNNSIEGLGLFPGTYIYTWPGDSLTINIERPAPLPTLDEWAMILMAGLMGVFAFMRLRKS